MKARNKKTLGMLASYAVAMFALMSLITSFWESTFGGKTAELVENAKSVTKEGETVRRGSVVGEQGSVVVRGKATVILEKPVDLFKREMVMRLAGTTVAARADLFKKERGMKLDTRAGAGTRQKPLGSEARKLEKVATKRTVAPKRQGPAPVKNKKAVAKQPQKKMAGKKEVVKVMTPEELRIEKAIVAAQFKKDIADYLLRHEAMCLRDWTNRALAAGMKPLCPCTPTTLVGWRNVSLDPAPLNRTFAENPDVKPGGHWEPKDCTARYRVAIIIPFRDRDYHLSVLLRYLRGQMLNYTLIVVEQNTPETFNKASLMNIAYKYAKEQLNPNCVIFHDVDIIPEDGRHFYTCRALPLHLGAYHSRHDYRLIYGGIFGAVTSFRPSTFEHINGFSNRFFGWGGEDDEMSNRLHEHRLRIQRDPRAVGGYTALVHTRDKGNVQRSRGHMIFKAFKDRDTRHDGLNSLRFVFQKRRLFPLYTWLLVDVLNDDTKIGFDLSQS